MIVVSGDRHGGWSARRGGAEVGRLEVLERPDRRRFLWLADGPAGSATGPDAVAGVWAALLDAALPALSHGELYVEIDEQAADLARVLAARGFAVHRRESRYLVPTLLPDGLRGVRMPAGYRVISAAEATVDQLRDLDDQLRQDVPGTAGWRNDPVGFARQTFDDPQFDAATYLLAVQQATGHYVGLVRLWNRPDLPRLGLIGVLPPHRRQRLALALLAAAFDAVHRRGQPEVSCEVDRTNTASTALLTRLGARPVGGNVELIRAAHGR
jgi:GNAT superfamily N-acetyltransferase